MHRDRCRNSEEYIMVTYLGLYCVLMEGSWIKTTDQGRKVVKKDALGFWVVQYDSKEIRPRDNPYVYPSTVSQVFFVRDSCDPAWVVVLRHDARTRRIEGERDLHIFSATGSARPTLSTQSGAAQASNTYGFVSDDNPEEVPVEQFHSMLHDEENPEDDTHLEDTQYEDELDLQHVA